MRWSLLLAVPSLACIRPPEIAMVDRATALEEQAAGSFDELEQRLYRAGLSPTPVPFTPNQLEDLGVRPPPLVENLDATRPGWRPYLVWLEVHLALGEAP
jgi:hypothetical protein